MEVPDHLYYGGGGTKVTESNSAFKPTRPHRNSYIDEMFVPDKITVGEGNVLIPHHHQPNDVLRDKPSPNVVNEQITPIPPKRLTANELPFEDRKKHEADSKKRANSQDNITQSLESINNTSLAIDSDPIRELKSVRRQMGRLATRVLELEDENNRRVARETGLWSAFAASLALITFLIFRK